MIVFYTEKWELYNYLIHHFLNVEDMNCPDILQDKIDAIVPVFFKREHYELCKTGFQELYTWTQDHHMHEMEAVHEYLLYYFLEFVSAGDHEFIKERYFDEHCNYLIEQAALEDYDEEDKYEACREFYYDIYKYTGVLYEDIDFLSIENLYNSHKKGNSTLTYNLGVNLDYYYSLLPIDIQMQYKTGHITLSGDIYELVQYSIDRIQHGDLLKAFWQNENPADASKIQLYLDAVFCAYFETQEIELVWDSSADEDEIQFEFWKRRHEDKKVLMAWQVDAASLVKGHEKTLLDRSSDYDGAYYLFICFTDEQYEMVLEFQNQYVYTDTFILYLNFYIVDARKKPTASRVKQREIWK